MEKKLFMFITDKEIFLKDLTFLFSKKTGAFVSFVGNVRDVNNRLLVDFIYYSLFDELMYKLIENYCVSLLNGKNDSVKFLIFQRRGILVPGEVNLVVGVASSHRCDAFFYCSSLVEFIKYKLPIWKKEYYYNGSFFWLGF